MISYEAIEKILGIEEKTKISPEEMADNLNLTFFPHTTSETTPEVSDFVLKLRQTLLELKVNIVPYEDALEEIPLTERANKTFRYLANNTLYYLNKIGRREVKNHLIGASALPTIWKGQRVKAGISIVAVGESATGNLPMDYTTSFKKSSVITVLPMPENVNEDTDFFEHFETAMGLFAYHMTNIVIAVDDKKWLLYNFNASHPIYKIENLKEDVLYGLIPKIAAPISPNRYSEFEIKKTGFDINDENHRPYVEDMVQSGNLLEKTNLYPKGKKIDDLPFRNNFYRWVGKLHLDNRNGMSYGFLARQLPVKIPDLRPLSDFPDYKQKDKDFFILDNQIHLILDFDGQEYVLALPEVFVLSQRSGSNKTNMNPATDLIKMGLKSGKMSLQAPNGLALSDDYKPSFDTKVILAHSIGNVIAASILRHLNRSDEFAGTLEKEGMAISHWHGYLRPDLIPAGFWVHGIQNPHVACSSPQSAIYALAGKLSVLGKAIDAKEKYLGDVHIEPHHGINICYPSLVGLGTFLNQNPEASILGNRYLNLYTK